MNTIKYWRDLLLFQIANHRAWISPFVGIAVVLFTLVWVSGTNEVSFDTGQIDNWWGKWGDPILGLATFLVAVVIWLTNTAKDWEDRLDKLLTVSYIDLNTNREVIRCENAFLAHEGDIRNWGQTLGRQSIGKNPKGFYNSFDFSNILEMKPPEIRHQGQKFYKHYMATFFLTALPKKEDLVNERDLTLGKFVWKKGEIEAQFIPDEIIDSPN